MSRRARLRRSVTMDFRSQMLQAAESNAGRVALIAGGSEFPYRALVSGAEKITRALTRVGPHRVIGLLCGNTAEFVWAFLGARFLGLPVAVLPTLAPPPLLAAMCAEAGVRAVMASEELAPRLEGGGVGVLSIADPDGWKNSGTATADGAVELHPQTSALIYTSGSTGRPKAVMLSDDNIFENIRGCVDAMHFQRDEVMLAILPLFHSFGLTVTLLLPLSLGGTVVLQERFTPRAVLQAIERHRATALVAVPSQYRLMTREPAAADLSSLRFCIAGAERLPENVGNEFRARFGVEILQGYGATEASPVISINPREANRATSVGRPLPNLRIVIREQGARVPSGSGGEICVSGPNVMLGYANRPDATAEKIANGELRTGDRGFLDAEGYLHVSGRADDLIKVAGEKVYPAEVEAAIERIEGVEEAAVVPTADATRGAALAAFVQPRAGAELSEAGLRSATRQHLEGIKVPRSFTIVEQLPRTATGKVDKKSLAK